ncbi:hypothetical protein HS125_11240 [bacterium]|nr:hypothetical protein [bacterium]
MKNDIRRTLKQAEFSLGRLKTQQAWQELDEAEGPSIAGLRKGPNTAPNDVEQEAGQFWRLCTTLHSQAKTLPPGQRRPLERRLRELRAEFHKTQGTQKLLNA